ncbi:zinc-binding alcohol dehydrogenase family protein [Hyalangium rubrum]|uniref:Zinc-type alcohol dehydrogenase-like protein n=1 Tax=Hyalangium rubrum TaxID=3103134 RepID=A0ABU5GYJ7_9BACT|nr:zinc-binding alcohol dehydrogenase family protein [Hyalangium sp. s54d21]MDY7226268.1 zinc-binding alcohol dehydrogenase family protein [Hyalangium sp. s54d21]
MQETMKALGQKRFGGTEVLEEFNLPIPEPQGTDLLIRVKAVGINPVDSLARQNTNGFGQLQKQEISLTGWDGAGIVEAVGPLADGRFRVGDEVFFAGNLARRGCQSEYTVVDSRIVGRKPVSLSFAEAAAIPLTALTVWEGMIEGCGIPLEPRPGKPKTALVVGGAGGVGSIGIQILSRVCGLSVVATASRQQSADHCRKMGASVVIDHYKDMKAQLAENRIDAVDYVLNTTDPNTNFDAVVSLLAPLGRMCCILPVVRPVNLAALFDRRISVSFELMFTRGLFNAQPEMQGSILDHLSALLDAKTLRSTLMTQTPWTLPGLVEAHRLSESGKAIGKTVMSPVG